MPNQPFAPFEEPIENPPSQSFWQKNRALIIGGVVGVLLLIFIGWLIHFGATHPAGTATTRDIMIIFMAVVSLGIGIALIALIYQIAMLTSLLRNEIKPLIESANETMDTLRGTTAFMSQNVVEPTIKASSAVAGVQRMLKVLFDLRPPFKS